MKKIALIVLLFAFYWQANGQREEVSLQNRHEVKLDPAHLIGSVIRIDYEYLLNDWSSAGLSVHYNFSSSDRPVDEPIFRVMVLGFYRLYFGRQPVSGFFLEGNLGIISGADDRVWPMPYRPENYTAFGAGIALGWKWYIPRSGIVLDIFAGGGRLFNNDRVGGFPRVGIAVGKRF